MTEIVCVAPELGKVNDRVCPDARVPLGVPSTYKLVVNPFGRPWAVTVTEYANWASARGEHTRLTRATITTASMSTRRWLKHSRL